MNDSESILAELRKIVAWVEMQRKITKWSVIAAGIFVCVFIPALIVFGVVMDQRMTNRIRNIDIPEKPDWYDVDRYIRCGNLDEAIRIGEELIQKSPQWPEGHRRLATAYLVAGNLREAREHFSEAVRLFPSEENEKLLAAIDKRINLDRPSSDQPTIATTPSQ